MKEKFVNLVNDMINDSILPNCSWSERFEEVECDSVDDIDEWFEDFREFFKKYEKQCQTAKDFINSVGKL